MVTRIRQILEHKQLTPTQFADLIGVGRPVVSHILSERNKPSLEVAQRIGSAFQDISLPWLLFGTGEMLAAEAASPPAAPTPTTEPLAPTPVSELPPIT
ncbi:MAG: XRE family transcriptional regulator, partial [Hymenobacter sp.]